MFPSVRECGSEEFELLYQFQKIRTDFGVRECWGQNLICTIFIGCIILGKVLINFSEPHKSSFLIDGREDSLKSCCKCLVECLGRIGTRCLLVLFSL